MALIALIGDCTTTTAVALAAAWPLDREVVILESDRSGGSLAGWLDTPATPSLSTLVASRGSRAHDADGDGGHGWADVAGVVQNSASGIRFIAAPVRSREAALAIAEAERSLTPMLADLPSPTVIADVGRHSAADPLPGAVVVASILVVLHRQDPSSAGAAAVGLDRLLEVVDQLGATRGRVLVGIIGDEPFGLGEITDHLAASTTTAIQGVYPIAFDPLSASVLAGRSGVSAKRLARLPLARSVGRLAIDCAPTGRPSGAPHRGDPHGTDAQGNDAPSPRLVTGIGR